MQTDLNAICERLRRLGSRSATPERRNELEDGVSSKWDGVKVAAAEALSQWGDPQSVQTVKDLLVAVAVEPRRYATTGAIAKLLSPHLKSSDLDWLIELFVHKSHADNGFVLEALFEAFPPDEVLSRLEAQTPRSGRKEVSNMKAAINRCKHQMKATEDPSSKSRT